MVYSWRKAERTIPQRLGNVIAYAGFPRIWQAFSVKVKRLAFAIAQRQVKISG
jgi:hypothetical protein